jgi:hypothetical protein
MFRFRSRTATPPAATEEVQPERAIVRQRVLDSVQTAGKAIITNSAAQRIKAEQDAVLTMSAAVSAAGHDIVLQNSAGVVLKADTVQADQSFIGLVIAREATLNNSQVLLTLRTALILGVLLGGLPPLIRALLQRLLPAPQPAAEQPERPIAQRLGFWLLGIVIRIGLIALAIWLARRWLEQRMGWLFKLLRQKN